MPITPAVRDDSCAPGAFHPAGCACQVGEKTECWTGPANQRHTGMCRDGTQICVGNADAEFGEWSPCMGEVRECGMDAGMPTDECLCVPGSVAYCDEDCTVSIFCSLTASKSCQPDGTWGRCTEAPGAPNLGPALFGDGGFVGLLGDAGLGGLLADAGVGGLAGDAGANWLSDAGAFVLDTGQCRHWFFGCLSPLGIPERWTGDCSQQFTCKRAPQ
ncbi:MAG TPA: hypothetical protein VJV78_39765 [Polyangiales bacterium]|nr:hypothetical protein [Polyangiales bacterium]